MVEDLLRKISLNFFANLIGLITSAIIIFVVPKLIDVEQFGYYQLYLFYIGYIGLFNFGLPEGIMLRYAGINYNELNKKSIKVQFYIFSCFCIMIASMLTAFANYMYYEDKRAIIVFVAISIISYLPRMFLQIVLQATNRIENASFCMIMEKLLFFIFVLFFCVLQLKSYKWIVCFDLTSKFVVLLYIFYLLRDLLMADINNTFNLFISEMLENIKFGSSLMLANFIGPLVVGVLRQFIEYKWDISVFAKVSLALSISGILMVFIRSISVVLLPILKSADSNILKDLYLDIRLFLEVILFSVLLFYYPVKSLLRIMLPEYSSSMELLVILFPVCLFECKMAMLLETYMKAYRLEKYLLCVNVLCVALCIFFSFLTIMIFEDIHLGMCCLLLLVGTRSTLSEVILSNKLSIDTKRYIFEDFLFVALFLFLNILFKNYLFMVCYSVALLIFFMYREKELQLLIKKIRLMR